MSKFDEHTHKKLFVTHIFRGERFTDESIPVDILPEISAYRDLVVEVARELFLKQHPSRQRVLKRFEEHFDLRLTHFSKGSTVVTLERTLPTVVQSRLFEENDVFDDARNLVDECIQKVAGNLPPPSEFPAHLLRQFQQFGRHLSENDSILLKYPDHPIPTTYTKAIRKKLVTARLNREEGMVDLIGKATGIETSKGVFQLEVTQYGGIHHPDSTFCFPRLQCPYPSDAERKILYAIERRNLALLRIEGIGRFKPNKELDQILEIHDIDIVKPKPAGPDINDRIQELSKLEDGWLNGEGKAFNPQDLEFVAEFLTVLCWEFEINLPYIYPTIENYLQAEWTLGNWEISLTFNFEDKNLEGLAFNTVTEAIDEFRESLEHKKLLETAGDFVTPFFNQEME